MAPEPLYRGGVRHEETPTVGDEPVAVQAPQDLQRVNGDAAGPVLPDYDGACTNNVVNVLLDDPDHLPAWFPEGIAGAEQIVLLVLDGLGWEQMMERRSMLRGLTLAELGADHDRRADHDRDRAHVDRDRSHAGRARRHRLPDERRRRRAQRPAVDELARRRPRGHPAGVDPARRRVRRPATAGRGPRRVPRHRVQPGAPRRLSPRAATGCRRRWWPRSCASCSAASRSSTPTTTASTRSPTSTA